MIPEAKKRTTEALLQEFKSDVEEIKTGGDLRAYLKGFHSPTAADLIISAMDVLADNPRRSDGSYIPRKFKLRKRIGTRAVLKDSTVLYWDLLSGIRRWIELFGEEHASYSVEDYPLEYANEFLHVLSGAIPRYAPWQERREAKRDQTGYYDQEEVGNGAHFRRTAYGSSGRY